ncbi:2-succinyl-5-enolpyruvyl-6-hydroxy-3-cyclohexene-1-carboxylic-acid synthase [Tenacibaculum geojense]|uniref:2-succinyl-5-enolpyruvyl-6-hydroxy-3-cyclohexene-1-carboxylate synthase n=1 Tax=Tenacibaculum geojense TaxID=915352 RepID=A0ABW3JSC2_9FLAO
MYPKKQLAQLVLAACEQYNISTVVISPGSRNAPLTIGFSNSKTIEAISVVDERCAAFFAMGIAQQQQKPVAVICTSGSALLNYYPAVAEAFYSKIPLVVISADRPKHLIDIGDGQTIRQENVFQNHILNSANLSADPDKKTLQQNISLVANALQIANQQKGPVHINVPFDEPLYETTSKLNSFNFLALNKTVLDDSQIDFHKISSIWNSAEKKLVLVGVNFPSEKVQKELNKLVEDQSVLVMTETTSNLHNDVFVNAIDKLITKLKDDDLENLKPDILLTFGGMVISKRIKQFLRKYQPTHHWHVDEHTKMDTYFCLSEYFKQKPAVFLEKLNSVVLKKSVATSENYQEKWLKEKIARTIQHNLYLKTAPYSDLKVFEDILTSIPENSQVQISNSSIIRYAQLFDVNSSFRVFCNRGTSGIDGSTSTAIGAAFAVKEPTVFITGDISFFYDSNALWNSHTPKNFRIILLNNDGGGIFKIIPGPKSTNSLSYFETPHGLKAENLAKMFGFDYYLATDINSVKSQLKDFYKVSNQPKILEIVTPSDVNDVVLQQYFKSL